MQTFAKADANGDGTISREEFVKMIVSGTASHSSGHNPHGAPLGHETGHNSDPQTPHAGDDQSSGAHVVFGEVFSRMFDRAQNPRGAGGPARGPGVGPESGPGGAGRGPGGFGFGGSFGGGGGGGSGFSFGFGPGGPGRPGPGVGPVGMPSAEMLFEHFDREKKGVLTKDNVPAPVWDRISKADANGDGSVTKEELKTHFSHEQSKPPAKAEDFKKPDEKPADEKPAADKPNEDKPTEKAGVTLNEGNNEPADATTVSND